MADRRVPPAIPVSLSVNLEKVLLFAGAQGEDYVRSVVEHVFVEDLVVPLSRVDFTLVHRQLVSAVEPCGARVDFCSVKLFQNVECFHARSLPL